MIVELWERDFSALRRRPETIKLQPVRYSHHVYGGPEIAEIAVSGGSEADRMSALEWLRCPVVIKDDWQRPLWWGYVDEVTTPGVGVSLDEMANKITVVYEDKNAQQATVGTKKRTGWANNASSQAVYGIKKGIYTINSATAAKANQKRATQLARVAWPILTSGEGDGVTLHCRGWWFTLGWSDWTASRLNETSQPKLGRWPDNPVAFDGTDDNYPRALAQSFQLPAGVTDFWPNIVDAQLFGADADHPLPSSHSPGDVEFAIQAKVGTWPSGVDLTKTNTLIGPNIGKNTWHKLTFATNVNLTVATTYWLILRRTGAGGWGGCRWCAYNNVDSKYSGNLYTRGRMAQWNGAAWGWTPGGNANGVDALFGLWGNTQTSTQIKAIVDGVKQTFLTGASITNASAVPAPRYHGTDENLNALAEAERLLDLGTDNDRRLLARVTSDRGVEIYEQAASTSVLLAIHPDGQLGYAAGGLTFTPLRAEQCPVGMWAKWVDLVPNTLDVSLFGKVPASDGSLGPVFIDSAEYDCAAKVWQPTFSGQPNVWGIGKEW